jgi:KDO2-lipid IV(A) lauroyltransferase
MRALVAFLWLLHWLPLPVLGRFGKAVGSLLFLLLRSRRNIALTNLRLCMPELSEAQRVVLARQHFQAYSRSVWERAILWWAPQRRLRRLIRVEPAVPLEAIAAGLVILCPHFVCLDVAGGDRDGNVGPVDVRDAENRVLDEASARRERFNPVRLFRASSIADHPAARTPYFMPPDMDFGTRTRRSCRSSGCRRRP